jgi:phosphoglycerate dehydrogenase-like enzyme
MPLTNARALAWFLVLVCSTPVALATDQEIAPPSPDVRQLIGQLQIRVADQPVRLRPGWHSPRVILVSPDVWTHRAALQKVAPDVRFVEANAKTAKSDLAAADAAINVCEPKVLAQAPQLQWLQLLWAGVERCVREPVVQDRHLLVTNMQRVAGPSMAEHVMAMMLVLSRQLPYFFEEQQHARWADTPAMPQLADLNGKTLLVVGLGGIGTEVAQRAHAFGMRVIATRASGRNGPDYVSYVGLPEELNTLAAGADYIVNCAPLTAQTTGIFDKAFFALLKPSAYFISVGRGQSTVSADLIEALKTRRIAGAGLDVTEPEPLPADSPLWHLPNVIITPHISAVTPGSEEIRWTLLLDNVRRYVAGEPMLSVVDVGKGY